MDIEGFAWDLKGREGEDAGRDTRWERGREDTLELNIFSSEKVISIDISIYLYLYYSTTSGSSSMSGSRPSPPPTDLIEELHFH